MFHSMENILDIDQTTAFEGELDTGAQEAKFYDDRAVQVVKRVGDNARNFNSLDDYAILTAEIPEGKVLHQFILKNAPTWNNNGPGSDIDWEV